MSLNDKLLKAAAGDAPGGLVPSEHFGVVLYEGDGKSGRSVNGGKYGAGATFGIEKSTTQATDSRITTTYYAKNVGSISGWLKKNGNTSELEYVFVTKDDTGSAHQLGINLLQEADSDLSARVGNGSSTTNVNTSGLTLNNDAWHHFVVTWNLPNSTNNVKVYVNGSLQATGSQSTGSWTGNSSRTFQLGHYPSHNTNNGFAGMLDQVRVFEKELSSSEVSTLYAETADTVTSLDPLSEDTTDTLQVLGDSSCIATYRFENNEDDLSGNYNGTGTAIQYAAGRYGQAASFNGSSSKLDTGYTFTNTTFSVSVWFKTTTTNIVITNTSDTTPASNNDGFRIYPNKVVLTQDDVNVVTRNYSSSLADGNWHNVIITNNGSTLTVYIDGVQESTDSSTSFTQNNSYAVVMGYQPRSTINQYFDGEIDQVRFFNKAISASEVTTLYNENSLVASYRFEGNANDDTRNYDGSATNVTYEYGLGFTPDFVWVKERTSTSGHTIVDSTRGATKGIFPNLTDAETTLANGVQSFDTGGFTVGSGGAFNQSGEDYVSWCLKANGGTTSSNTDGTNITSTVQVNSDAGFSIVKWTGDGNASSKVGHGLGVKPDMIISKALGEANDWNVNHVGIPDKIVYLQSTIAAFSGGGTNGLFGYYSSNTTTTFEFINGSSSVNNVNKNNIDYIAYCFHSVEGFSKFGSYVGNGSTDGPIVETGFEPAFVIIKNITTADNWVIFDNKRNLTNSRTNILAANSTAAEYSEVGAVLDFYSNGFQSVGTGGGAGSGQVNKNNNTYIYMAFAADPDTEAPAVAKSFNIREYDGGALGSDFSVSGLGFSPNLVWIKGLGAAHSHYIVDTIRGADKVIASDLSNSDPAYTPDEFKSFDSDGFTLIPTSGGGRTGYSANAPYVAWVWKADDNEPTLFGGNARAVYKFEDNANDVTGNHNATASNVSYVTGKFNKAADFNGSSSYINTGLTISNWVSNLNSRSVDFTISLWANVDSVVGGDNTFLYIGNYNAYTPNYAAMIIDYRSTGSKIRFTHSSTYIESTSTISLDTWYHIVCVRESGVIKLYINGVLENSATPSADMQISSSAVATLGALYFSSTTHGELDGMLDQIRFYSGAVSDIGVAALYAETASDNDDLSLAAPKETIISANANAGFSIIKYTGDGQNGNSIPHGLSATPTFWIIKQLTGTQVWLVGSDQLSASDNYLILNQTNAQTTNAPNIWSVDSTKITFDTSYAGTNNSGDEYIMYAFHSVSGFSKFGSYAGNGTTQTINVGFQPDFVMIKAYTNGTTHTSWTIIDSVRYGSSSDTNPIYANLAAVEGTRGNGSGDGDVLEISFTSNGFKLGDTGSDNASDEMNDPNNDYIYWATKIN